MPSIKLQSSFFFVILISWASLAHAQGQAQTDNELLQEGLRLFEDLQYEEAIEPLSAALLEPGNTAEERILIYRTLGTLYVYLGRQQQAELALERLLCVDSSFDFGEYESPRIRQVFDRVRDQWNQAECEQQSAAQEYPVTLDHESPTDAVQGSSIELEIAVDDPALRVNSLILYFRASGEAGFSEVPGTMSSPGTFTATIPGDAIQPPAAEYYIQAVGDTGDALASLGTARAPLRIPVTDEDSGGVARKWWFWTIIGTIVIGAGLGIGLGLGLQPDGPDPSSEGTLIINVCDSENPGSCFIQ